MIRSMTAFHGQEKELDGWQLAIEIRTVNHRHLDIALRLPENFRFLESDCRAAIQARLKRGRVDCTVIFKRLDKGTEEIRINRPLLRQILAATRELENLTAGTMAPLNAMDILQWPGVLQDIELDREYQASAMLDLLNKTLEGLAENRENEGRQLAGMLEQRCLKIKEQAERVKSHMPGVLQGIRSRIVARLSEITATPDQDRLEQELVYLAQKLDVAEELDRLTTHLDEVLKTLKRDEPVGRRLDFLMQELNREANTLGSKSADAETTRASVEMKVLIEQMREQVQNIE